ncbi:hypothetical protein [Paraburkholderia sp. WSM4179]|nr:hypothetical protein [Paraburkholderia sp. WSM4179]MDH6150913.1 hypothetical protein [Paraburkholderia sp. WSM4179]
MIILAVRSDIFVIRPVFTQADQLAFIAVEVLNDQLRLVELRPFQADQKILAGASHGNVFGAVAGLALGQNEFATFDGAYTNGSALRGPAQFNSLLDGAAVDNGQLH